MTNPYRLVLADDHTMFRHGLKKIISEMADIEVVGEAGDGIELINIVKTFVPDMVILDILMPNLRGIEAIPEIRRINPDAKILILSMYDRVDLVRDAFSAGANGYLVKGDPQTELFSAIRTLRSGKTYVSQLVGDEVIADWIRMDRVPEGPSPVVLSNREREVLKLLAEGKSYKEIGGLLFISARTVICHRTNIMEKLNLKKNSDLIKYAIEKNYV